MVNKKFILLSLILFLFPLINADNINLQEFFNNNVTQLTITISQNYSSSDFYLNTSGTSFDMQNFTFEQFTIGNVKISDFLNGINGQIEITENSNIPYFNELTITQNTISSTLLDFAFSVLKVPFNTLDINNNISVINNHLENNPLPIESDRKIILTKDMVNYNLWNDKGFGDIPENFKEEIRKTIEESVLSINIPDVVEQFMPFIHEQNITILDDLDFNYTAKVDINALYLKDGNYNIPVMIERNHNIFIKNVTLILIGIRHIEESQVNDTFIPTTPEIKNLIDEIRGLGENNITISIFDNFSSKPNNVKTSFKYLNITLSNHTNATLSFKLNKSDVNNPANVFMYVLENEWVKLSTSLINNSDFYYYKAEIPHFSLFMIAEELPVQESGSGSGGGGGGGSSSRNKEPIYYPTSVKIAEEPKIKEPVIQEPTSPVKGDVEINFIPEPDNLFYLKVAFFILLAILIAVVILLIYYRRRKKWK